MTHSTLTILFILLFAAVAIVAIGDAALYLARIWWPRVRGIFRLPNRTRPR